MLSGLLPGFVLSLVAGALGQATVAPCPITDMTCANGRCLSLNKYCDGIDQCGDGSDEPKRCTPCNRTYYGEVGRTYNLELHRPKEDKLPYRCHITLSAAGDTFGDIVQVTLERFTLGKFSSFLSGGCPDGYLTLEEKSRPFVGGLWCGTSWGPVLYYSETDSLTLHLTLLTLSSDQGGYNFEFMISYKMLPRRVATTRFGGLVTRDFKESLAETNSIEEPTPSSNNTTGEYYLGNRIGMTYCSRMFSDCDRKECRLQSPNFPGVYPRNMTCYYAVRQQSVPPGKHALISIFQPEGQLVNIRSQSALYVSPTQATPGQLSSLKVWKECDEVQDYVTVYDGYTTRDPVLLKFCGGGSPVPRTVSSGPELLVEFSTSPFGTFLYPAPPQLLHGFQLKVGVEFVEREGAGYTRNKRCEFWLSGTGHGVLESPRNSLPPNTTCLYHLWGAEPGTTPLPKPQPRPPRYRVWLSVLKYHVGLHLFPTKEEDCATSLKIWDGTIKAATSCNNDHCKEGVHQTVLRANVNLLASYCREQIPRSCDHQLFNNGSRPCTLSESFLTAGDSATLELRMTDATALRMVSFKALYEFVDFHQDGQQYGTGKCSRIFTHRQVSPSLKYAAQNFASPREVFLYGRGGAKNISCRYRFVAERGERVRITVTNLRTANRSHCETHNEGGLGRLYCNGHPTAFVRIVEIPFPETEIRLPKDCLCSNSETQLPFVYTSSSHTIEFEFMVEGMGPSDDYRGLGFEGSWEFVRRPVCKRRLVRRAPSGQIHLLTPSKTSQEMNCEGEPWVIEPSESRYLYVKVAGLVVAGSGKGGKVRKGQCATSNRIELHAGSTHLTVCPQPLPAFSHSIVEIFSEGWIIVNPAERLPPVWAKSDRKELRNIIVEFISREPGSYTVTWLELSRRRMDMEVADMDGLREDCPHKCPELDACINASLWCDGTPNCPSATDEAASHCLPLPPVQLALLALITLCALSLLLTLLCRRLRPHRRSLKSLPSDTDTIVSSSVGGGGGKEIIC